MRKELLVFLAICAAGCYDQKDLQTICGVVENTDDEGNIDLSVSFLAGTYEPIQIVVVECGEEQCLRVYSSEPSTADTSIEENGCVNKLLEDGFVEIGEDWSLSYSFLTSRTCGEEEDIGSYELAGQFMVNSETGAMVILADDGENITGTFSYNYTVTDDGGYDVSATVLPHHTAATDWEEYIPLVFVFGGTISL